MKKKKIDKKIWMYLTVTFIILGVFLMVIYPTVAEYNVKHNLRMVYSDNESSYTNYFRPSSDHFFRVDFLSTEYTVSVEPNQIDQIQNEFTVGIAIGQSPAAMAYVQAICNDRTPMYGMGMYLMRQGMPTEPLFLGVVSTVYDGLPDHPWTDPWICTFELAPDVLPDPNVWYWLTIDFTDYGFYLDIPAGTCFYMGCTSADLGDGNDWGCGIAENDPYADGRPWIFDGSSWAWDHPWDMTFVTYTTAVEIDPPDITITASYTVIPMFFGGLSFIAAMVTGSKFYLFM